MELLQEHLIPLVAIPAHTQVYCPICWDEYDTPAEMIAHIGNSHTKVLWQQAWIYKPQHAYWELAHTKLNNLKQFPQLTVIYRSDYLILCKIKESERRATTNNVVEGV